MTKRDDILKAPVEHGGRYELYIEKSESGFDHLRLLRVAELEDVPPDDIPHEQLRALACRIYDTRRARSRFFNSSLLGEPVWDMLLALYCLPSRDVSLTVGDLSRAAGLPLTTGIRHSRLLEDKGLIERGCDPQDKRRTYLRLSSRGEALMGNYLGSIFHKLTIK